MKITSEKFNELEKKGDFAKWSSWAIWNNDKPKDLNIIKESGNNGILHTNYVIIGLNPSKRPEEFILNDEDWANFHCGGNDKKLCDAFADTNVWRAFMTDLFNIRETKFDVDKYCRIEKPETIKEQIKSFRDKLTAINVTKASTFILLGNSVQQYFNFFVNDDFYLNHRIKLRHYSAHWGKKKWKDEVKEEINKFENGRTNT